MINFAKIEKKWQAKWEKEKIYRAKASGEKFYVLEMYPYPSAYGLHMGHAWNYSIGDIYARYKRMKGFNVLHPMGFDSFGLPAENAAIKNNSHPKKFTDEAIKNYIKQMKSLGLSYDWDRLIKSHDSEYYKWDQWIFLKLFERRLAYKKKSAVNWCNECNTVLANEQVINGRCWRHENCNVEIKHLDQWFFKITDYAEELYKSLDKLENWPEDIKAMQRNWIGRSEGAEIDFIIDGKGWNVFTTRPDTLFGVTFLVVSSQHPDLMNLVTEDKKKDVEKFLKKIKSVKEEDMEKEGVFTGSYAEHPITGEKIPVWAGSFVVADYGSGIVMGVPCHEERDYAFAKKYDLEIRQVIAPYVSDKENHALDKENVEREMVVEHPYTGYGLLINSGEFNGLKGKEAQEHIITALQIKGKGRKKTAFRLRDWLVSRQRFWGTPIPIVYCDECGIQAVPEKDLPVKLPENIKFENTENPLKNYKSFIEARCPKCKGKAKRETDTMDTFVNSSWYFLRYLDSKNKTKIFDKNKASYWVPIDLYIGGREHANLHLIYFRFYTKFLRDLGLLSINEPVERLFNQGMLHAEDGFKMSKSRGNVILPETISEKYGLDTARLFLASVAGPEKDIVWSSEGIEGSLRFVMRLFDYFKNIKIGKSSKKVEHYVNKYLLDIERDIEAIKFNLAIIKLRALFEVIEKESISKGDAQKFVKILAVFAPHIAEEFWMNLGKGFVAKAKWPEVDNSKINEEIEITSKAVENLINDAKNIIKIISEKGKKIKRIYIYAIPKEMGYYDENLISEKIGKEVRVFAVNDKKKYDPENKAIKARLGKPAIFAE